MTVDVYLVGEGPNEIGEWARSAPHRPERPDGGVLGALCSRLAPGRHRVVGGATWKSAPKLGRGRDGLPRNLRRGESHNLRAHIQSARELGAVLVFARDSDRSASSGTKAGDRGKALEEARSASGWNHVGGGLAVRQLEAWILALLGERRTETLGAARCAALLRDRGVDPKDTRAFVQVVNEAGAFVRDDGEAWPVLDLCAVPVDAVFFRQWVEDVHAALGRAASAPRER